MNTTMPCHVVINGIKLPGVLRLRSMTIAYVVNGRTEYVKANDSNFRVI